MARNSSGTYSLFTPGNPVVTNTVISSTWANNTLADIATAMTDSLSRSGDGSMLAGLELFNGVIGAPGLTWGAELTSGLYRSSAGDHRYSIAAADVLQITAAGLAVTGTLSSTSVFSSAGLVVRNLSAGADLKNTLHSVSAGGVYSIASSTDATPGTAVKNLLSAVRTTTAWTSLALGNATDNTTFSFLGTGIITTGGVFQGPAGTLGANGPTYGFSTDTNTGAYSGGADIYRIQTGGVLRFEIGAAGNITTVAPTSGTALTVGTATNTAALRASDGTVTVAVNTETAKGSVGTISNHDFSIFTNNSTRWTINSTGITSTVVSLGPDGAVGAPAYSFSGDATTGLYRIGSANVGVSMANSKVFEFLAAASGAAKIADTGGTMQLVGFRPIPRSTTATTLAIGDVGKCVAITAAINIPISVFAAGDVVSIYNDSAGALNLTISAGTLRLGGTATTGTRSIAARGICTIWFNVGGATPEAIATGSVT